MKQTKTKQMGSIVVKQNGQLVKVPAELTVITTEHDDGRIDKRIVVPRLPMEMKNGQRNL